MYTEECTRAAAKGHPNRNPAIMCVIHYSHSNYFELSIINCGQGTEKII